MTTIKLKGINKVRKKLAGGKIEIYYYHRGSGERLPGVPGSADFLEAYKLADRIAPRDVGTISQLIREYLASPKFKKKALSTQGEYKRMLTKVEKAEVKESKNQTFGTMPIAALAAPRVIGKFLDYHEEIGLLHPREADNRLTVLSTVFSYAKSKGRIVRNPIEGFERLYDGDRADIIWTEADIAAFMDLPSEQAESDKKMNLALDRALILAMHTGQRYGDLVKLRWADYDGQYIRLKQSKTSVRVNVRVTTALKKMLDGTPRVGPYILVRPNDRPWFTAKSNKELGSAWRERMTAVKMYRDDYLSETRNDPDLEGKRLHFNDLRGTAVTLLAEAGCTVPEIVSITGHTLASANQILEKYLARTKTLSDSAMKKFENATATDFANRLQTGTES